MTYKEFLVRIILFLIYAYFMYNIYKDQGDMR